MLVISLDVLVCFKSANIPFRYYETVPHTDTKIIIVSGAKKPLAGTFNRQHETLLNKKKKTKKKQRAVLAKITSYQKYK